MTTRLKHWLSYWPTNMYVVRSTLNTELIFCSARISVFAEHTDACTFSPKSSQFDHNSCRSNVRNILKICRIYLWSKLIWSSQLHSGFSSGTHKCTFPKPPHLSSISWFNTCRLIFEHPLMFSLPLNIYVQKGFLKSALGFSEEYSDTVKLVAKHEDIICIWFYMINICP
jgi:hypothetical protein